MSDCKSDSSFEDLFPELDAYCNVETQTNTEPSTACPIKGDLKIDKPEETKPEDFKIEPEDFKIEPEDFKIESEDSKTESNSNNFEITADNVIDLPPGITLTEYNLIKEGTGMDSLLSNINITKPNYTHPKKPVLLGVLDDADLYRTQEEISEKLSSDDVILKHLEEQKYGTESGNTSSYKYLESMEKDHLVIMIDEVLKKFRSIYKESTGLENAIDNILQEKLSQYMEKILREQIYESLENQITNTIRNKINENLQKYTNNVVEEFTENRINSIHRDILTSKFDNKKLEEISVNLLNENKKAYCFPESIRTMLTSSIKPNTVKESHEILFRHDFVCK